MTVETQDLFAPSPDTGSEESGWRPLADCLRPTRLDDFFGQDHLLGNDKPLRSALESGRLHSMILWGPPGTGKTTLARMIAHYCDAQFLSVSAVLSGVKDIRAAIERAKTVQLSKGKPTLLFVDEVHRFNKSQQDAFLPYVEDGTVTFIGATTENPSFELNNALLSRVRVYVLKALDDSAIARIVSRATSDPRGRDTHFTEGAVQNLVKAADGDARRVLNLVELTTELAAARENDTVDESVVKDVISGDLRRFDKHGDLFYEQISALHKSVRGSSPDASLYWLCRMIDGGCDPLYIARRVVRMASEDIGNADPRALELALNAWEVQERLGSPEGELAIAQAVVYLACASKSNAVYKAFNAAMQDARKFGSLDVPLHLRNASTQLMQELDYGQAYRYAHDEPEGYAAGENYFPEDMPVTNYYQPVSRGLEARIRERLAQLDELDRKKADK